MAFGINIRSDNGSCAPLRSLWKEMAAFEGLPSMEALNYPPHVTLAVYDDNSDAEELRQAADRAFGTQTAVRLVFTRLRFFDTSPLILWAEPSPAPALMRLHGLIYQSIPASRCRPHYRPGAWQAHCTLAIGVREDRRDQAMARCNCPIEPIEVTFDVGDIASFPPVCITKQWPLSPAPA